MQECSSLSLRIPPCRIDFDLKFNEPASYNPDYEVCNHFQRWLLLSLGSIIKVSHEVDFLVITYIGSGRLNFYKDCTENAARLKQSLDILGVPLIVYNFADLRKLVKFPNSDFFYFLTRYGAGSWFWKPIIILDALEKYGAKQIIYVDADCVINKNPINVLSNNLELHDVAVFRQNSKLAGWISSRSAKILGLETKELHNVDLLTAGIIVLRNSTRAKEFLNAWRDGMRDPRVLLHPAINHEVAKHRHDQSVLSALVFKGFMDCKVMDSGFYSRGKESLEDNVATAWVYTGELETDSKVTTVPGRIALFTDYYSRRIYDVVKSIFITPIHVLFFLAQKPSGTRLKK